MKNLQFTRFCGGIRNSNTAESRLSVKEDIQKNAIFHHSDKIMALNRWGTRTRTRKDRTRICSVANYTIPQTSFASRFPLDYGCKVTRFFITSQAKTGKLYDCRHEYQKIHSTYVDPLKTRLSFCSD